MRLALLTLLLLSTPLRAGENVWTSIGPEGGTVTALAFAANGRTVYAGTHDSGVYKSIDSGRSWSPAGAGVRGAVEDVETDPATPARVYVATSKGVFQSDDAGATWTDLTSRLPGRDGLTLAWTVVTAPAEPGTVYVSLYDPYTLDPSAVPTRVYRSLDHGVSWQPAVSGLPSTSPVQALAAHPRQRGVLFAATTDGLFRSADSGRTWVRSGLRGSNVVQVAFDPLQPERLYAVRTVPRSYTPYPEVLVSTHGGKGWRAMSDGIDGYGFVDLVLDPFTPGTAYLAISGAFATAIYKTTDGGGHWREVLPRSDDAGAAPSGVLTLAANPRVPGMLLTARSDSGERAILRTLDGGASWEASGSGFRGLPVSQALADPAHPDTLYAVPLFCCWLWKTTDAGRTWRKLDSGLPPHIYANLTPDPATPSTLYLTTVINVYKSLDAGETWTELPDRVGSLDLAISPARPRTLYSAAYETVRKSQDAGTTWEVLPALGGYIRSLIAAAPSSASTVYTDGIFYSSSQPGVRDSLHRSKDGGATWTQVFSLGLRDGVFTDLLVHPRDPDRVLASFGVLGGPLYSARSGGVFRSSNGGGRWRRFSLSPESPPVFTLAEDPRDPSWVYAGSAGAVFVSRDRGATWTSRSAGLPPGDVQDLEVSPLDPATVYAATSGGLYAITQTH